MPLQVRSLAQYLSVWPQNHNDLPRGTLDAHRFVKLVKGDALNGTCTTSIAGFPATTLRTGEQLRAIQLAAKWAARFVPAGTVLVPVPGSRCSVGSGIVGTADALAGEIAAACGGSVGLWIRMDQPLKSAHSGGPRFADQIFPHLRFTGPALPVSTPATLIDDVLTSGGHLRACRALLARNRVIADSALTVGRTLQNCSLAPWSIPDTELDDWAP